MLRSVGLWMGFCLLCVPVAHAQEANIRIEEPKDDQTVGDLPDIEGRVSSPRADVWVIVRPKGTVEFWVQPQAQVGRNGEWWTIAYIGRRGEDFGKKFQVRAVANPTVELRRGQILSSWPRAESSSEVITVVKTEGVD